MNAASQAVASSAALGPQLVPASSAGFDLLLACCADLPEQERSQRIAETLRHPLDWDQLLRLAEHHGVIPRLYREMSAAQELGLQVATESLQPRYQANVRRSLWLTGELLHVLDHLQSRGIEALPYKGPVLAQQLYGNVAERQFSDLDLLIHATDVPRARAGLLELGYKPNLALTAREERAYLASGYEYTFRSAHGRDLLEMQWQILPRFYSVDFDVEQFFNRALEVRLNDRSVRTLGAEDLLLVLCVHAAKHVWLQLSCLCDIAALVRSQPLDWELVRKQAQGLGIERIMAVTFLLASKLLETPLPSCVCAHVQKDGGSEVQARDVLAIMMQGADYNTESAPYFQLMLRLRERWQDRLRLLWRLVFTPSVGEWSAVRLPAPLFPLYRLVRVGRLAGRTIPARYRRPL